MNEMAYLMSAMALLGGNPRALSPSSAYCLGEVIGRISQAHESKQLGTAPAKFLIDTALKANTIDELKLVLGKLQKLPATTINRRPQQ